MSHIEPTAVQGGTAGPAASVGLAEAQRLSRASRDELAQVQSDRLRRSVAWAYERVPFYREAMSAGGVTPADIAGLEDLHRLPFTLKADIQERFPYGICAVEPGRVARVHSSSGSTGRPINTVYTAKDIEDWAVCMARGLSTAGMTADDVSQVAFRYTLFTGAFGHHLGAERLGATIIPTSSGSTDRQILMMQAFNTTVVHCTPSYALVLAEQVEDMGIDPRSLALRLGVHGAEPMTDGLRDEVQERLAIRVARDYGLTELGGPGVSIECESQNGYHVNEDYFYPEIIDPSTGAPLPDGEVGELVFTCLAKEGSPILRYRTRDLTSLTREPCSCGRTLARHGLILGRTDDMLIVGGVNFFPTQVESVVCTFEELAPHYLVKVCSENRRDRVTVHVEAAGRFWAEQGEEGRRELREKIQHRLRENVGFRMAVEVLEPFSLARSEGKSKRVVDERT
jgi:phenylacetate-CoA ligase